MALRFPVSPAASRDFPSYYPIKSPLSRNSGKRAFRLCFGVRAFQLPYEQVAHLVGGATRIGTTRLESLLSPFFLSLNLFESRVISQTYQFLSTLVPGPVDKLIDPD